MKRIIWTHGIVGGVISAAGFLIGVFLQSSDSSEYQDMETIGWLFIFLSFVPVLAGMRKAFNNGYAFSFGKQFRAGILMTCIVAAIYSLNWVIYLQTESGAEFSENMWQHEIQSLSSNPDVSAEELEQSKEMMISMKEMYQNPLLAFLLTFLIEPFPPGLLITLIASIFWGNKGRPYRMRNPASSK